MSISEDRADLQTSATTYNDDSSPAAREAAVLAQLNASQQALKDLAAATRQREEAARDRMGSQVRTQVGGRASITMQDGRAAVVSSRHNSAQAVSSPTPGMITINGVTTTIEAAKRGGLIPFDYDPATAPKANSHPQHSPLQAPQQPSQAQSQAAVEGNTLRATAEQAQLINASSAAIEGVSAAIGSFQVSALLEDGVVNGIPAEPPRGVSPAQMASVVAGFTAQAEAVLSGTGATVELMNSMLSESELRSARLATFKGNDNELKSLGAKAVDRLVRLPNDPATFSRMTAGFDSDVQITRVDGETMIKVPEWPRALSWSAAVRQGLIYSR